MSKILVLFTADFPFGSGETFLETEITFLSKGFHSVHIISANTQNEQTRILPENCSVERFNLSLSGAQKVQSLVDIFSQLYRAEKRLLDEKYGLKMTSGIQKTMLISLFRAKLVAAKAESILQSTQNEDELFLTINPGELF